MTNTCATRDDWQWDQRAATADAGLPAAMARLHRADRPPADSFDWALMWNMARLLNRAEFLGLSSDAEQEALYPQYDALRQARLQSREAPDAELEAATAPMTPMALYELADSLPDADRPAAMARLAAYAPFYARVCQRMALRVAHEPGLVSELERAAFFESAAWPLWNQVYQLRAITNAYGLVTNLRQIAGQKDAAAAMAWLDAHPEALAIKPEAVQLSLSDRFAAATGIGPSAEARRGQIWLKRHPELRELLQNLCDAWDCAGHEPPRAVPAEEGVRRAAAFRAMAENAREAGVLARALADPHHVPPVRGALAAPPAARPARRAATSLALPEPAPA